MPHGDPVADGRACGAVDRQTGQHLTAQGGAEPAVGAKHVGATAVDATHAGGNVVATAGEGFECGGEGVVPAELG